MTPAADNSSNPWSSESLLKLGPGDALDIAWKAGLFTTLALYTVGLIIATFNAEGFGAPGLELNRTIYILIGAQWAVQALFGYALANAVRTFWQQRTSDGVTVRVLFGALPGIVLTIGVFYGLVGLVSMSMRIGDPFARPVVVIFCVIAAMGFSLDFAVERIRRLMPERTGRLVDFLLGVFLLAGRYGAFFLLSMAAYAGVTYSLLPRAFGGGRMATAEIFVKDDGKGVFGHLSVTVAGNHSNWEMVYCGRAAKRDSCYRCEAHVWRGSKDPLASKDCHRSALICIRPSAEHVFKIVLP